MHKHRSVRKPNSSRWSLIRSVAHCRYSANRPRLMRDLVLETLAGQADIEVAGEASNDDEIKKLVETTHPDFVILTLQEPQLSPGISNFLLRQYPQIKIVAIAPEQDVGVYYGAFLEVHHFHASEQTLLGLLRGSLFSDSPAADEGRKRVS